MNKYSVKNAISLAIREASPLKADQQYYVNRCNSTDYGVKRRRRRKQFRYSDCWGRASDSSFILLDRED